MSIPLVSKEDIFTRTSSGYKKKNNKKNKNNDENSDYYHGVKYDRR